MQVPTRLKWRKENGRFASYPMGLIHPDRLAIVQQKEHLPNSAPWFWQATWPGWFSAHGNCISKQEAADLATQAWWAGVATHIPRDIDAEVDVIVARALVLPPPNSLFAEDSKYLRKVLGTIRRLHEQEMRADALPAPLKNLVSTLSEELYRRRLRGGDNSTGS